MSAVGQNPYGPFFASNGDTDYLCRTCGMTALASVSEGQVQDIAFECSSCGSYNHVE